jgi:2-polyprenyl-6-methoxyphenol hydroxylase-like FAD-dependent oxidoreductase
MGIAGPTLAYWLRKGGHEVVLVESAPHLRTGGYVIDFGLLGYDITEKMRVIPQLRELGYKVKETRFVDRQGRTSASIVTDSLDHLTHGRYITLQRSDLAATIYGALDGAVETIFGDSIASIEKLGRNWGQVNKARQIFSILDMVSF